MAGLVRGNATPLGGVGDGILRHAELGDELGVEHVGPHHVPPPLAERAHEGLVEQSLDLYRAVRRGDVGNGRGVDVATVGLAGQVVLGNRLSVGARRQARSR